MIDWSMLADNHALVLGATRRGKTGLLELVFRAIVRRGFEGVTFVDPHGGAVRNSIEWLSNPGHGAHGREVHILDPASSHCFGLNPLEPDDDSWEACHDAANVLASVVESRFDAPPEETPRLARIIYIAGMLSARNRLTVLDLLEILSLGGEALRESLLTDFDNRVVRSELEDLHTLASRSPREFLNLVESAKNRFVRWLGDRRLARILGQRTGISPRAVMDGRDIVLADLSSLSYADAAFVGCLLTSMYFAAARRRPPLRCARHRLLLDEAESLLTIDTARMTAQTAKYGLNIAASIQGLGQLRARSDLIADTLMTNCNVKICFGGLEAASARYIAENFFAGYLDLCEWKKGSERPVAVNNVKTITRSSARAEHVAEHESWASTRMHSRATAVGTMTATASAHASGSASGDMTGQVMTPDGWLLAPPSVTSQSAGHSASSSQLSSRSEVSGTSLVEIEGSGEAETHGRGTSRGTSISRGESEVFITRYEWMPSQLYSIEEQRHRVTGELMNLPRRECFVKVEGQRPFRTRTADLVPAYRSPRFKAAMLPTFLTAVRRRSRYLIPIADADAFLTRRNEPAAPMEPDLAAPEPMPIVEAPERFAHEFWRRREAPPKPASPAPPGRPPVGDLGPAHEKFRVIDGASDQSPPPKGDPG